MPKFSLKVTRVRQETHDVKSIFLEKPGIDYKPGQYMMVELDVDDPENGDVRPLSLASSPTENFLLFSTKNSDSLFKQKFNALSAGETLKVNGPMGKFVLQEGARSHVMLSGGIGITPFRSIAKYATDKKLPAKITLLYSNRSKNDIAYLDELSGMENQNPNLRIVNTVSDDSSGWNGRTGRIDEKMVREFSSDFKNTIFYICGPPGMVNGLTQLLKSMQVPDQSLRVEQFSGY